MKKYLRCILFDLQYLLHM